MKIPAKVQGHFGILNRLPRIHDDDEDIGYVRQYRQKNGHQVLLLLTKLVLM
jgi:hypothetical protein